MTDTDLQLKVASALAPKAWSFDGIRNGGLAQESRRTASMRQAVKVIAIVRERGRTAEAAQP